MDQMQFQLETRKINITNNPFIWREYIDLRFAGVLVPIALVLPKLKLISSFSLFSKHLFNFNKNYLNQLMSFETYYSEIVAVNCVCYAKRFIDCHLNFVV